MRKITLLVSVVLLLLSSCSGRDDGSTGDTVARVDGAATSKGVKLRIAEQFGIAYAPVTVMRITGMVEEALPGYRIEWVQLGNAAAIREAMVANRLDIGFMGIPPFLIGEDRGMEWEIFTGLAVTPLGLVTTNSRIISLADFGERDRIALPQPGSIQHILLAMALQREFGDATRFDDMLVSMAHPDAMNALSAGAEIDAHFTSPPYLYREMEFPEARLLLSGEEAFGGEFSFIVGVATDRVLHEQPEAIEAFRGTLEGAIPMLLEDGGVQEELAAFYELSPQELREMIDAPGNRYTTAVLGVERFREFMEAAGYLTGGEE